MATYDGTPGNDQSFPTLGPPAADGDDILRGYAGDDTLQGFLGDDTFYGGDGDDHLHGFQENKAVLDPDDGDDILFGGAGDDRLFGDHGDDILQGDSGDDVLSGGAGIDIVTYAGTAFGVFIDLARGTAVDGFGTTDTLTGIENADGTAFDDRFTGNGSANHLRGFEGSDFFFGAKAGGDIYDGGADVDAISYFGSAYGIELNLATGAVMDTNSSVDTLISIEDASGTIYADILIGSDAANTLAGVGGNDLLDGAAGNDVLYGGEGNNRLIGGAGDDQMFGMGGNDLYFVDSTGDFVSEDQGNGVDEVRTDLSIYILPADVENLTLTGLSNSFGGGNNSSNVILGNQGNNRLLGLSGNDTLLGGQGDDTLMGDLGKDLLTGGGGLDRMVINSMSESGIVFADRDVINTFAHGDKIDLSAIDANTHLAGNQAFTFVNAFTGVAGQLPGR